MKNYLLRGNLKGSVIPTQASTGEEGNMRLVPSWEKHIECNQVLRQVVDALLATVGPLALRPDADVRPALLPIAAVLVSSAVDFVTSPVV